MHVYYGSMDYLLLLHMLAGDRGGLSLLTSSSPSLPSMQRALLLTLTSELALLVANAESDILTVLLLLCPDLTLYMEDAGILVISGRRLPGMFRLIPCTGKTRN